MTNYSEQLPITCYIGLGSNLSNQLGSPLTHIENASNWLRELGQVRLSSIYQSVPMGPQDQPDYLNAVAELITTLEPLPLLDALQAFEQRADRQRLRHWGERSLDLDLLLYGDESICHERLIVPHVGLFERNFVLIPLLELNPNLKISGKSLSELPNSHNWVGIQCYLVFQ